MTTAPDDPGRDGTLADADFEPIAQRLRAANERIEAPPALIERIDAGIRAETVERRFRRTGSLLAAAAVIALAVTAWWLVGRGGPTPVGPPEIAPIIAEAPAETGPAAAEFVRLDFEPDSSQFARRVESTKPTVTIHLIYQSATPLAPADDGTGEPEAMRIHDRGAST